MQFCKIIYKYVNEFINEEELVSELENIKGSMPKYASDIDNLIEKITVILNTYSGEMMRYQYIYNEIINNQLYKSLAKNMTAYELMDMITSYLMAPNVPAIDQELFDEMVFEAIKNGKSPKEECWRLATNYCYHNFNFQKIIDYFISTRDVYYIGELICAVGESLDIKEIIEQIISTHDRKFIKQIYDNQVISSNISKEDFKKLSDVLKKTNIY